MDAQLLKLLVQAPARLDTYWGLRCPSKVAFDTATALATPHQILGFNKSRIGIMFVGPNTGRVSLANDSGLAIDQGITLTGTAGVLLLMANEVGNVVQLPWFAVYPAGATPAAWIEILEPATD